MAIGYGQEKQTILPLMDTLTDGVVTLSPPTMADVAAITAACQDEQIARWTSVPSPYRQADAIAYVRRFSPSIWAKGGSSFLIHAEGAVAGAISLMDKSPTTQEIGYWLAYDHRGRGFLSRAITLILDYAFTECKMERITWTADVGNWPSWRAVWRHGFRREGTLRQTSSSNQSNSDGRKDEWVAALLRDDPRTPATVWDGPTGPAPALGNPRDPEELVRQFHATYQLPIQTDVPSVDRERIHMRMALISEEFAELVGAVYGGQARTVIEEALEQAIAVDDHSRDVVEAADALADMIYVIYGMALESGIPLDAVLAEVQRSNLSKLGADGKPILRADGKILKGPNYTPPDIATVLATARLAP